MEIAFGVSFCPVLDQTTVLRDISAELVTEQHNAFDDIQRSEQKGKQFSIISRTDGATLFFELLMKQDLLQRTGASF